MAQLDWPGGNHFLQKLQCITVNSLLDLKQNPNSSSSDERRADHHQMLLRWSLKTILSVPRRGFVPGQTVTAHERRTKRIVVCMKRGPIPRGTKDTWFTQLDVPPIPPSGLVYCPIIHLEYYIKLTVESLSLPKQKLQIPLIIGTIPLEEDFDQFTSASEDDDKVPESLQKAFGNRAPSIKFAESVWGKTELSTNQRRVSQSGNSFTPTYVLYRRTPAPTLGARSPRRSNFNSESDELVEEEPAHCSATKNGGAVGGKLCVASSGP